MSKHLSLSDRALIEKFIAEDFTFAYIAKRLCRSPATISREIKLHRCFVERQEVTENDCIHYTKCLKRDICSDELGKPLCSRESNINSVAEERLRIFRHLLKLILICKS